MQEGEDREKSALLVTNVLNDDLELTATNSIHIAHTVSSTNYN